jgi:predicted RNase H-like nuclease (RuvC/YqgF family)
MVSDKEVQNRKLFEENRELSQNLEDKKRALASLNVTRDQCHSDLNIMVLERNKADEKTKQLRKENEILQDKLSSLDSIQRRYEQENDINMLIQKMTNQGNLKISFKTIMTRIQQDRGDLVNVTPDHIAFFEGNDIITQISNRYSFTSKGKELLRIYSGKEI